MTYNYQEYKIILYVDGFTKSGNVRSKYKIKSKMGELIAEKIKNLKEAKK